MLASVHTDTISEERRIFRAQAANQSALKILFAGLGYANVCYLRTLIIRSVTQNSPPAIVSRCVS